MFLKIEFIPPISTLGNKDTYRGSDYRLAIIVLYTQMRGKCPIEIEVILLYTKVNLIHVSYISNKSEFFFPLLNSLTLTAILLHAVRNQPNGISSINKEDTENCSAVLHYIQACNAM